MATTCKRRNTAPSTAICIHKDSSADMGITINGQTAGNLRLHVVRPGNNRVYLPMVGKVSSMSRVAGVTRITFICVEEKITVCLNLKCHPAGYTGTFQAAGQGHAIVRLVWELPKDQRGFPLVPAFMYGWNEGGKSPWATYPQLRKDGNGGPAQPWVADEWLVRADRSSHGITAVISDHTTYAMGGRDVCRFRNGAMAEKNGLGISSANPHRLSFSLGFVNMPYTYSSVSGRNFISRPEGFVNLDRGMVGADFCLFLFNHGGRQEAAARLLRESYSILHDRVASTGSINEAITAIANALVRYGYSSKAKNFYVAFQDSPRRRRTMDDFSNAWAGGLRTAYPLLRAGYRLGKRKWILWARRALSHVAEHAISPKSGLFFENYTLSRDEWNTRGWWYGFLEKPGHSGYVNGQMCHYLLLAFQAERELGGLVQRPWLQAARRVLDHVVNGQGKDGRFGYTYGEHNGRILDGEGFSGCWFVPALASLYRLTGESRHLKAACRAMSFYRHYVEAFDVYGGPHDIYKSPDEEGILAWITAAHFLHQITGEDRFRRDLLMGLDYEFSWKFAYNVVNEVEPLKSMNWCSTGGSVTSVNNSHIHPMGCAVLDSLLYAADLMDDVYLWSRLTDSLHWTLNCYLHHDGHYDWGKKGMINERFCYTDSLLAERYSDGSPAATWFCGHSWASGAVLEALTGSIFDYVEKNSTPDLNRSLKMRKKGL